MQISAVCSISMTACSSILALGMMPLCLVIYTSTWVSGDTIKIPYDSIGKLASTDLNLRFYILCVCLVLFRVLNVADDLSRNHTSGFTCAYWSWDVSETQVAQSSQKDPQGKF